MAFRRGAKTAGRRAGLLFLPVLDLVLVGLALSFLAILLTGGVILEVGGRKVDLEHVRPFLDGFFILALTRYFLRTASPFLGIGRFSLATLPERLLGWLTGISRALAGLDARAAVRLIGWIIMGSICVKILNAWFFYGFFCGDDVEIQEMTFARLFQWSDWRAWDLRNAIFPLVFLYPAQAAIHGLGASDAGVLIFTGRAVVILFSGLNLWLVYRIASRLFGSPPLAVLACLLLAVSQLHTRLGSSELPRTVSSSFVLGSFLLLLGNPIMTRILLGAALLGIGASIRFSEAAFIASAALMFAVDKKWARALIVGATSCVAAALAVGVSDWLYWGEPFHSLGRVVDFTLIEGRSSRGYQSPLFYLTHLWSWTNALFLVAAILGVTWKTRAALLWAAVPFLVLCLLPHKEARYMLPVLPFVVILAAGGLRRALDSLAPFGIPAEASGSRVGERMGRERWPAMRRAIAPLVPLLIAWALLFELGGFRFSRTEGAVDMARYLASAASGDDILIEQWWKAGGRLYLWRNSRARNLDTDRLERGDPRDALSYGGGVQWVALREKSLRRLGLAPVLIEEGYSEVLSPEGARYGEYRLYRKSSK